MFFLSQKSFHFASDTRQITLNLQRNHIRATLAERGRLILVLYNGNADSKWVHRSIYWKSVKWFWCWHSVRFTQPIILFAESSEQQEFSAKWKATRRSLPSCTRQQNKHHKIYFTQFEMLMTLNASCLLICILV